MFVPLHDGVPIRHVAAPFVTVGFILVCAMLFAIQASGILPIGDIVVAAGFGTIPAVLFGAASLPEGLPFVPEWLTPLTSVFLHVSWLHLVGNMLFLWVFGDNVEDAMGHWRFALFLALSGAAGALAHALANPASEQPLVGASGAVSGVIAAYLILHPHVRVLGIVLKAIPLRIPAFWALGAWIGLQLLQAFSGLDASVGWWAHLGGLAAGAVMTPLFVRAGTPMFGRGDLAPTD